MTSQVASGGSVQTSRQTALVPVLIFVATVVAVISSLGAPLVPTIASDYGVAVSDAQWSLTVTLLVGAAVTPVLGRLADGPRRRGVLLLALGCVVVGCVLAALPYGFAALVGGRALQGVGLGLVPLAIAVARDHLPAARSRSAVAMLSVTTVGGVGLGYPLTGVIDEHLGLHAGYWFGAVVAVVALLLAAAVVPASSRPARALDLPGALLLALALTAVLVAVSDAEVWGWTSPRLLGLAGLAALLLVAWVHRELRAAAPLVDLRLLRDRTVLTADVTALCAGIGMYLLLSLVTRFVQTPVGEGYGFGSSVVVAGLALLPFSVGSVAASRVVPTLARRTTPAAVMPLGCLVLLAASLGLAFARTDLWEVFVVMGVAGLGVGCTFSSLPGLIVGVVPAHETGSATSFNQVLRMVGFAIGSALSATVLQTYTTSGHPTNDAYTAAALLGVGVCAATAAAGFLLPTRTLRTTERPGSGAADVLQAAGR